MQLEEVLSRRTAELHTLNDQMTLKSPDSPPGGLTVTRREEKFRIVLGNTGKVLIVSEEDNAQSSNPDSEIEHTRGEVERKGFTFFMDDGDAEKVRSYHPGASAGLKAIGDSFGGRFTDPKGNTRFLSLKIMETPESGKSSDWLSEVSNS